MSLNRGRNIYTLGNFQLGSRFNGKEKSKRCQLADPFERDPFKIHSYNFRYADRPSFPMPAVPPRINNNESVKDCQTYFYNYDFPTTGASNKTLRHSVIKNDERPLNLNKFQGYRRRKFLHESGPYKKNYLIQPKKNSLDLQSNLNLCYGHRSIMENSGQLGKPSNSFNKQNFNIKSNTSQRFLKNDSTTEPVKQPSLKHSALTSTSRTMNIDRRCSAGSGCEISINIKSLEDNSLQENVNIKIETDSISRDINIPLRPTSSGPTNKRVNQFNTSNSFVVNNKLSKCQANSQNKQNDARKCERDRVQELTSINSSQILNKSCSRRQIKSAERLPSLIPFRTDASARENSKISKENLTNKNSSFQRIKDNLKVYDSKTRAISSSYNNNLNGGTYFSNNSRTKTNIPNKQSYAPNFNNSSQKPLVTSVHSLLPSSSNARDFKSTPALSLSSNTKLPLNVNINVYADKLKLLKV